MQLHHWFLRQGDDKKITMHSVIMHYGGYTIIVENYLYMLYLDRTKKYLTFQDIINVIDRIEAKKLEKTK